MNDEIKLKIKNSLIKTREKRSHQICKVIELKIDSSRLNKKEYEQLKMFFVEAKWIYNYILSLNDPFHYDYKINPIQKFNKEGKIEDIILQFLPAKTKQTIVQILQQNIKSLSAKKKKNMKVGRLKYISDYKSIDLNQYGQTHKIVGKNRVKINGIKRPLIVRGLNQITEQDLANAKLVNKPDGYYIKLTTFIFPKGEIVQETKKQAVGIDFGITNNLTTSNGQVFNISIGETEHLKKLQQNFSRSQKGSNNRYKLNKLIKIQYQHLSNKKLDAANKIVHELLSNYNQIFIQDENLKGWKKEFGRQVQHSVMGTIKAKLRLSRRVHMISRWEPTTQKCYNCGTMNKISRSEKIYRCGCGLVENRDIKAAKTIMKMGIIEIGVEYTKFKPVEFETSGTKQLESKFWTMKQEDATSLA